MGSLLVVHKRSNSPGLRGRERSPGKSLGQRNIDCQSFPHLIGCASINPYHTLLSTNLCNFTLTQGRAIQRCSLAVSITRQQLRPIPLHIHVSLADLVTTQAEHQDFKGHNLRSILLWGCTSIFSAHFSFFLYLIFQHFSFPFPLWT